MDAIGLHTKLTAFAIASILYRAVTAVQYIWNYPDRQPHIVCMTSSELHHVAHREPSTWGLRYGSVLM